jgi:hypothetical protein
MKPRADGEPDEAPRAASEAEQMARDSGREILSDAEKARLAAEASRGEDA